MRFFSTPSPAHRPRRRSSAIAAGLAFGILATAGIAATPASQAQASDTSAPASFGSSTRIALASYTVPARAGATAGADANAVVADTLDALVTADATRSAALVLAADIEASALDLGQPDTSVSTADLEVAAQRLSSAKDAATPFVPYLTDALNEAVASVDGRVSQVRGLLDAAKARKAAEEAAEKARLEAEAAAAAAAAKAAAEKAAVAKAGAPARTSGSASLPAATGGGDNSPAAAQAAARDMAAAYYGWGDEQFSCLVPLWNKESGWNYRAANPSGAYGIPQALPGSKMASAGADWQTNASTQVAWGLGYIAGRYGSPCSAWSHSQATGWY